MAFPQIAGFARLANGDAAPVRRIAGQATLISRADHDLEYDSVNDEFIVGNPEGGAILVLRGGSSGEEPPVRVIQGPHTEINDPGAYTKPFTISFTASLRPKEELMEYICQENQQDAKHLIGGAGLN